MLEIPEVSSVLDDAIRQAIDTKTKPLGALGQLEVLAFRLARIQQSLRPLMQDCQLTIFAADHGISARGVSAYPKAVTRQMLLNFLAGGAASNVFARQSGVDLRVVDAGVAGPPISHPNLLSRRMGEGTRDFASQPAMSQLQLEAAMRAGIALGLEGKGQAVAFGEMGIANTSSAALVTHKIIGIPLHTLCGRGTGLDDAGLERKRRALEQAAARTPKELDVREALCQYGGFETVMMTGAMLGAAARGRAVIVDGYIATSSALAAVALKPAIRDYLVFAHRSGESGHSAMLHHLVAQPLLDLGMRLGEGSGALLAWPLLRAAAAMLTEMASFESALVSGPL